LVFRNEGHPGYCCCAGPLGLALPVTCLVSVLSYVAESFFPSSTPSSSHGVTCGRWMLSGLEQGHELWGHKLWEVGAPHLFSPDSRHPQKPETVVIPLEAICDAEIVTRAYCDTRCYQSELAGATTLAELTAVGRPAVLVPYPHAADDHQMKNARALAREGAATALAQAGLDAEGLAAALGPLLGDEGARRRMAGAARRLGRPDAAASIVDDLSGWLGWTERPSLAAEGATAEEPEGSGTRRLRLRPAAPPRRPLVFDGAQAWA
ncbi:MAG: glycosyltransferase, partial [Myxococcota bacterium]